MGSAFSRVTFCLYRGPVNISYGVAQNSRARVTQVLGFGSIYQGASLGYFVEPQPDMEHAESCRAGCMLPARHETLMSTCPVWQSAPRQDSRLGLLFSGLPWCLCVCAGWKATLGALFALFKQFLRTKLHFRVVQVDLNMERDLTMCYFLCTPCAVSSKAVVHAFWIEDVCKVYPSVRSAFLNTVGLEWFFVFN